MLRGNKILCAKSGLNAQHGSHAYKYWKIIFSRTSGRIYTKLGMQYLALQPIIIYSFRAPMMTLTNFIERSVCKIGKQRLVRDGKSENNGYFGNCSSMRPERWQKQTTNEGMRFK